MEVSLSGLKRFFAYKDTSFFSSYQMKLDGLVGAEAAAGKAHALTESGKDTLLAQVLGSQGHFTEPGRRRGDRL